MKHKILTLCCIAFFIAYLPAAQISKNGSGIIMSNDSVELKFNCNNKFSFIGLKSQTNSFNWFNQANDSIWNLEIRKPNGKVIVFNAVQATYLGEDMNQPKYGNDMNITFKWKKMLDATNYVTISATVKIDNNSPITRWSINVGNIPAGYIVSNIEFPVLTVKRDTDSQLITPHHWGTLFDLTRTELNVQCNYPSSRATMQLLCQVQNSNTLYYAAHDKQGNMKTFDIRSFPFGVRINTNTITSESWTKSSGSFSLPWETYIGVNTSGWKQAVKQWYKPFTYTTAWGTKTFEEKNYPEWLLKRDFWLTPGTPTDAVVEYTKEAINYFGADKIACHWYYWHEIPFDTYYPEFFPAKPSFIEANEQIRALGVPIVPYVNGRLWDTTTTSFSTLNGKTALAERITRKPYIEVYASEHLAVVCPSSETWANIMSNLALRIKDELNGSGIYYDQIASASPRACWNPAHSHPKGGGNFWYTSYQEMINSIHDIIPSEFAIATEQNAECYIDVFDIMLMANVPPSTITDYTPVPVFPLVYSDRALLYGFNVYNNRDVSLRYKNMLMLLWGAQLGWMKPDFVMASTTLETDKIFLKNLIDFRSENHDLFNGGTYINEYIPGGDNPIKTIEKIGNTISNVVMGAIWKGRGNTGESLILVNMDDIAHNITLPSGNVMCINARSAKRIEMDELLTIFHKKQDNSNDITILRFNEAIQVLNLPGDAVFKIIDLTGRIATHGKLNSGNSRINLDFKVAPGIYILNIEYEKGSFTEKIIF